MAERTQNQSGIPPQNGLTSIPQPIHCVATDEGEDEHNEADRVIIQHFLQTLAEIALAVAARRGKQRQL